MKKVLSKEVKFLVPLSYNYKTAAGRVKLSEVVMSAVFPSVITVKSGR
jgi:hypothetical protein